MSYETILLDIHGQVGLITLNRPQALNALNAQLIREVNHALDTLADAAPEFGISLVLSMMVAYGLRSATTAWKSASGDRKTV